MARTHSHTTHVHVRVRQTSKGKASPKAPRRKPAKGPRHRKGKAYSKPAKGNARSRSRRSASGSKFIQGAIKRPGALTRSKRKGESTMAAAQRLKRSGTPLQKRQASFYLNVLAPASKRKRSRGTKRPRTKATKRRRR